MVSQVPKSGPGAPSTDTASRGQRACSPPAGSCHSGSAVNCSARLGPRRFFPGFARGFLFSASPSNILVLARSPSSAFCASRSASFSEFKPTCLSASCRSCSAPSWFASFFRIADFRVLLLVVLPVFTFVFLVHGFCFSSAIFPPFSGHCSTDFRARRIGEYAAIPPRNRSKKNTARIMLRDLDQSGAFCLLCARAPRRWPDEDQEG